MNIEKTGALKVIMDNPGSRHCYFGWPTAARLKNGKIAVAASGFRLRHVCPFGKTVLAFSEDDGETYTRPAAVIDTVLDDRDGGITPFGESGVIVTSFNNTLEFQRGHTQEVYDRAYLDTVTAEQEAEVLGATFRISFDNGVTFGPIYKSPITSPHGPIELSDGTLLWVGRTFSSNDAHRPGVDAVEAHKVNTDGSMEYVGTIEPIFLDGIEMLSCEPHAIALPDGTVLAHIRVQHGEKGVFTVFQSASKDSGRTWTKPVQLLGDSGGSPPHLCLHSSGVLICTYGFRGAPNSTEPFGIRAMFSKDLGKTWKTDIKIYETDVSPDLGYPSTVELKDGSLLTVFYACPKKDGAAVIMQQKWSLVL